MKIKPLSYHLLFNFFVSIGISFFVSLFMHVINIGVQSFTDIWIKNFLISAIIAFPVALSMVFVIDKLLNKYIRFNSLQDVKKSVNNNLQTNKNIPNNAHIDLAVNNYNGLSYNILFCLGGYYAVAHSDGRIEPQDLNKYIRFASLQEVKKAVDNNLQTNKNITVKSVPVISITNNTPIDLAVNNYNGLSYNILSCLGGYYAVAHSDGRIEPQDLNKYIRFASLQDVKKAVNNNLQTNKNIPNNDI